MAQQDVYRTIWGFTSTLSTKSMSTGVDFRLGSVITPRSELQYAQDIANAVRDSIQTNYLPHLAVSWTLAQVDVYNISNPIYGASAFSGQSGALAQEVVPLRSAPVAQKVTGLRGRSFRGRMFLLAVTEPQQSGGVISVTLKNDLNTWLNALRVTTLANSNVYESVVYSPTLVVDNLISFFSVQDVLGGLRGRQDVN